jgi:hypothetical protein
MTLVTYVHIRKIMLNTKIDELNHDCRLFSAEINSRFNFQRKLIRILISKSERSNFIKLITYAHQKITLNTKTDELKYDCRSSLAEINSRFNFQN